MLLEQLSVLRILVIDDNKKYNQNIIDLLKELLKDFESKPGLEFVSAFTYKEAQEKVKGRFNLIALDGKLDDGHFGPNLIPLIRVTNDLSLIMMTSSEDENNTIGIEKGADFSLNKVFAIYPHIWDAKERAQFTSELHQRLGLIHL